MQCKDSEILVFDVGEGLIGIRAVNGRYRSYYWERRALALKRLQTAKEIVSFNGNRYDIKEVSKVSQSLFGHPFEHTGKHTDLSDIYWPNIVGSSLTSTYENQIGAEVQFPNTHEGSNQLDVYMTLALWRKHKSKLTESIMAPAGAA